MHTLAFVQAERAGPRGPKASGVKAGWPRFGTKRGAQPANPTAARRDARLFLALLGAKRSVRFDQPPGVLQFRSEEHTSELQSLMRITYAVFCLKKKT